MKAPLSLLIAALCALSATACAAQPLVDLSVIDRDSGDTLTTYRQHGRSYVPGVPGHRYALHLYNHSGERVMVVLSVDGVNAISGQTASASQAGYVLAPWQSADIEGWRKSDTDVARFYFTALDNSYAARTGRPDNVGVIGMAVFRERVREPVYAPPPVAQPDPYAQRDEERSWGGRGVGAPAAAAPATGAMAKSARNAAAPAMESYADRTQQQIGTGHGERTWSPISHTDFERLSQTPQQVTQIWYDTPQALAARGIMPRWYPRPPRNDAPQAFPVGYVPDPPARW
ncbi:MAG: hypothetical protein JSS41_06745 [Proteobacteria bacterium]|nr:hypothetical protein [Pseudomonadota bacterium]